MRLQQWIPLDFSGCGFSWTNHGNGQATHPSTGRSLRSLPQKSAAMEKMVKLMAVKTPYSLEFEHRKFAYMRFFEYLKILESIPILLEWKTTGVVNLNIREYRLETGIGIEMNRIRILGRKKRYLS